MTSRAGAVLLLLAGGLYLGVARPLEQQALAAGADYARARGERETLRRQVAQAERREALLRRAREAVRLPAPAPDAVAAARALALAALQDLALDQVHLSVSPRREQGPQVRVHGTGTFSEALAAVGRLSRPGSGLVLQRVTLNGAPDRVVVDLEAVSLVGQP